MAVDIESIREDLIRRVWDHYRTHRAFPPKKQFVIELKPRKVDWEKVWEYGSGLSVDRSDGQTEVLTASWRAILRIQEVRNLFAPYPAFLRLMAATFIAHPTYNTGPRTNVGFEEFASFWPTLDDAVFAADVLTDFHAPVRGSGKGNAKSFSPDLDDVRFEKVETLEDVLSVLDSDVPPPTRPPSGPYRELIRAVLSELLTKGEWPVCIPFAVEHRTLGNVRRLVEVMPDGILTSFGYSNGARLEFWKGALPYLELTPAQEWRLVSIINALVRLWEASSAGERFSAAAVAKAAGMSVTDVGRLGLLLHRENWLHLGAWTSDWTLTFNENAAPHLREVTDLADYLKLRQEIDPSTRSDFAPSDAGFEADVAEPLVPEKGAEPVPPSELEPEIHHAVLAQGWYLPPAAKHLHEGGAGDIFVCARAELLDSLMVGTALGADDARAQAFSLIERLAMKPNVPALGALKVHRRHDNRTKQEIAALTKVQHPHLVPLLASDMREEPVWLVMPYYAQGPLDKKPAGYLGSPLAVLEAMRPIVEATAALHAKGIIHRDIKPGNIFIANDGGLILGDVGTSLHQDEERHTRPDHEIISRDWVPDWVVGRPLGEWTFRADVFMLCRTMYFLVTGKKPRVSQLADAEFDPVRFLANVRGGLGIGQLLRRHLVTLEKDVPSRDASVLLEEVDEALSFFRGGRIPALLASLVAPTSSNGLDPKMTSVPIDLPARARSLMVTLRGCGPTPATVMVHKGKAFKQMAVPLPDGNGAPGRWTDAHVFQLADFHGPGRVFLSVAIPPGSTVSSIVVHEDVGQDSGSAG